MEKIPIGKLEMIEEMERIEDEKGFAKRLKMLITISSLKRFRDVNSIDIEEVTGYSGEAILSGLLQLAREEFIEAVYLMEKSGVIKHCSLTKKGERFLEQYLQSIEDCKNAMDKFFKKSEKRF